MDFRHTPSAILGGENRHTWSASNGGNPKSATIPVTTKNNQQTSHNSHYPRRPVETSFKKTAMIYRFTKKKTIYKKVPRTHLCPSVAKHRPHCRSEEPMRSVASKRSQFVDCRANDSASYRDFVPFGDNMAADVSETTLSPKRLCHRNVL